MKLLYLILFLFFGVFSLFAQKNNQSSETMDSSIVVFESGKQYVIIRHDGVEYIGELITFDNREILIKTKVLGEIYIPKYEIKTVIELEYSKLTNYTELKATGPFTTRYSFTTNALPIKKGENYGMINLYGPEAHLAFSNHFNAGIMTSWIASPLALALKYSFTNGESKTNLSLGSMFGSSGYLNGFKGYGGLHWLNVTFGTRKNNITFAGGYAYLQTGIEKINGGTYYDVEDFDKIEENNSSLLNTIHGPVISIAGIFRIGSSTSFVFDSMFGYFNFEDFKEDQYPSSNQTEFESHLENVVITRNPGAYTTLLFLMPGLRFQKTDKKAFQICIAGVSAFGDWNGSFPLPMCSWFYRF